MEGSEDSENSEGSVARRLGELGGSVDVDAMYRVPTRHLLGGSEGSERCGGGVGINFVGERVNYLREVSNFVVK